jgi:hypothetical protein
MWQGGGNAQDVVALPEGIGVDGNRAQIDIRVFARSLARGAAVKVPDR